MNKPLHYAKLVLDAWPHLRAVIADMRGKDLPHDAAIAAGVAALAAIMDQLDDVATGKKLAEEAEGKIHDVAQIFQRTDSEIDRLIVKKFPEK
jgi:hypothetical protein